MDPERPRNLVGLAAHLELSVATVSFVLNGRAREMRISPRTESRVLKAAAGFGIQPNPIAASLRSGRTGSIGLVVPDIANPFFGILAQQIDQHLRESGDVVLLSDSGECASAEEVSLGDLQRRRVDGLIVAPVGELTSALENLAQSGFPAVCTDRVLPELGLPQVAVDHAGAARRAVEALLDAGHRCIGCLRARPGVHSDEERVRGYREALEAARIEPRRDWIAGSTFLREAAARDAEQLFACKELTAIVPLAGQATLGLLEAMRHHGIRCPEDISVVAFDEQPWCGLISPGLSTVRQPIEAMARESVRLLRERIAGRPTEMEVRLQADILLRDSIRQLKPKQASSR